MCACLRCRIPDPSRLDAFNLLRGIVGGASLLRDVLTRDIDLLFPDLIKTILTPHGPFDLLGLTNIHEFNTERRIYLEVVEAPLDFDAAHKLLVCQDCGCHESVVVIGASFLAFCRNVLATSKGQGLSPADLKAFVIELWDNPQRLRRAPLTSLPPDPIVYGVAWMAAHEFGHALASSEVVVAEELAIPDWCKATVLDELRADAMSFVFLSNRIFATPFVGDTAHRLIDLANGIEMFMRGSSLLHSLQRGKHVPFDQWPLVLPEGAPTPTLRWKTINSTIENVFRLHRVHREIGIFDDWDSIAEGLV